THCRLRPERARRVEAGLTHFAFRSLKAVANRIVGVASDTTTLPETLTHLPTSRPLALTAKRGANEQALGRYLDGDTGASRSYLIERANDPHVPARQHRRRHHPRAPLECGGNVGPRHCLDARGATRRGHSFNPPRHRPRRHFQRLPGSEDSSRRIRHQRPPAAGRETARGSGPPPP